MLSRLERIKSFIDWVEIKALDTLEQEEKERDDFNIEFHEDRVKDIKTFLTCVTLLGFNEEFNQDAINEFFEYDWWRDLSSYDAGIEQFCFIFNDGEVWKVSSLDVPQLLADMLHQIPSKYHFLFPKQKLWQSIKVAWFINKNLLPKKVAK